MAKGGAQTLTWLAVVAARPPPDGFAGDRLGFTLAELVPVAAVLARLRHRRR